MALHGTKTALYGLRSHHKVLIGTFYSIRILSLTKSFYCGFIPFGKIIHHTIEYFKFKKIIK